MFPTIVSLYMLAFCRIMIGLVFILSSISKVRDIAQFRQTIRSFHILPQWLSKVATVLFICGEVAVVLLILIGGPLLMLGFSLAISLLLVFCLALVSALVRRMHIFCNCFGASTKQISHFDVWRNAGLIIFALLGCAALAGLNGGQGHLSLTEWGLIGLGGVTFVALWLHLADIVQLFQPVRISEENYKE